MIDCIIVGYHEADSANDGLWLAMDQIYDLPAPIRTLLRTQLCVDNCFRQYLDTLSYCYNSGKTEKGSITDVYSVSELPNLGTLYLVNFLRKHGHTVEFVNSFTFELEKLTALLVHDPLTIAITTTFYMLPAPVIEIVRFIRRHNDHARIIVGGPLIDNYCRDLHDENLSRVFDHIGADLYIWEAQGEATLEKVVAAMSCGRPINGIPNVFSKLGSSWALASKLPENNDLNECAVDWDLFDLDDLGKTVSTRTARSCSFKCAFCDYPQRAGALSLADISTVEKELESLGRKGVRRVAFIDDTFNVPVRRFKELCKMMSRRSFGLEWFSYFRCGNAREPELYDLMRDAGCKGVLLGIESGDDQILSNMDKKAKIRDYSFGIEQLKKRNIFIHASIVVGFPGESENSLRNTVDFLNDNAPDTFTVNHWYYLHSTPIHLRASSFGLSGAGYSWSHQTMTSQEALDAADRIFHSVTNSAWMPVNGLDFWGVPYLLEKQMTSTQILEFLKLAKPLTAVNIGATRQLGTIAEHRFRNFCRGLSLSPSRYQKIWS